MPEIQQLGQLRTPTVGRASYYIPTGYAPNLYAAFQGEFLRVRDPQAWELMWKRLEGQDPAVAANALAKLAGEEAKVAEQIAKMQGDAWKYETDMGRLMVDMRGQDVNKDIATIQGNATLGAAKINRDAKIAENQKLTDGDKEVLIAYRAKLNEAVNTAAGDPDQALAIMEEARAILANAGGASSTSGEATAFALAVNEAGDAAANALAAQGGEGLPNGVPAWVQETFRANIPRLTEIESAEPKDYGTGAADRPKPDVTGGSYSVEQRTSTGTRTAQPAARPGAPAAPSGPGAAPGGAAPSGASTGQPGPAPSVPSVPSGQPSAFGDAMQALLNSQALIRQTMAEVREAGSVNPYGQMGTPIFGAPLRTKGPITPGPIRRKDTVEPRDVPVDDAELDEIQSLAAELTPAPAPQKVTVTKVPTKVEIDGKPLESGAKKEEPAKQAAKAKAKEKAPPKEESVSDILGDDESYDDLLPPSSDNPDDRAPEPREAGESMPRKRAAPPKRKGADEDDAEELAAEFTPKKRSK